MSTAPRGQAQRYIQGIHRNLSRLEDLLRRLEAQSPRVPTRDTRSELLSQVHVAGAIDQRRLFDLLDQRSVSHAWIGAQVGAEYLDVWQGADGRTWYRVTQRAVRELYLGQMAASSGQPDQSQSPFAEDWDSQEDSAYDSL